MLRLGAAAEVVLGNDLPAVEHEEGVGPAALQHRKVRRGYGDDGARVRPVGAQQKGRVFTCSAAPTVVLSP